MKKLLSVVLAVIMSVSVLAAAAIPALAVESPTATTAVSKGITTPVNGVVNTKDVRYSAASSNPYSVTFKYTGAGQLLGWEENMKALGFVKGVDYDYTAVENSDKTFTVTFISDKAKAAYENGDVIVNALVKFDGTTKPVSTNDSQKSPGTGIAASVIAGSIAVAGAGIAVLSATKKKDAE